VNDAQLCGGRFCGLGFRLHGFLSLLFGSKFLFHLQSDGIGVHFIHAGSIADHCFCIRPGCRKKDACLDQQPRERAFIDAAKVSRKGLADPAVVTVLPYAVLPRSEKLYSFP
jgi:hypothetical protein